MVTQALLLGWYLTTMSHMDQVYTDASFRLVVLGSLSVEQVSQLSSELESG